MYFRAILNTGSLGACSGFEKRLLKSFTQSRKVHKAQKEALLCAFAPCFPLREIKNAAVIVV
jgi:hypothetical protein